MVDTCHVTGTLISPDGSPLPRVAALFHRLPERPFVAGDSTTLPHVVRHVTSETGAVSVYLVPGPYMVRPQGASYPPFRIDVPDAAAANLSDIQDDILQPPPSQILLAVSEALAARNGAVDAKDDAEEAADRAEAARAAARTIFPTTAAGLAATTDGDYFSVIGSGNSYLNLFLNNSGSGELVSRLPSLDAVNRLIGTSTLVADFNDITDPGFYRSSNNDGGTPNTPEGLGGIGLFHVEGVNNRRHQMAFRTSHTSPDVWVRSHNQAAGWSAWERLAFASEVASVSATVRDLDRRASLVAGSDTRNSVINDAIREIVIYDEIPEGWYLNLRSLSYISGLTTITAYINAAQTPDDPGETVARGNAEVGDGGLVTIWLNFRYNSAPFNLSGYIVIDLDKFYPDNSGAILPDNATYEDRGLNLTRVTARALHDPLVPRHSTQFVPQANFGMNTLLAETVRRAVRIYLHQPLTEDDYLSLSTFVWGQPDGKPQMIIQIRLSDASDQPLQEGPGIALSARFDFDSEGDIKGVRQAELNSLVGNFSGVIEVDFSELNFNTSSNSDTYFINQETATWLTHGFSQPRVNEDSARFFRQDGGLPSYRSLYEAFSLGESRLFAVGGNTFKSSRYELIQKSDLVCTNHAPLVLRSRPVPREYDLYYQGSKLALEAIDSRGRHYLITADYLLRVPSPLDQERSPVADTSAADLVLYDVEGDQHYSLSDFDVIFTASGMGVDRFRHVTILYDEELAIMSRDAEGLHVNSLTENGQSSLRTFTIDGQTSDKWVLGEGVNLHKSWSISHHGSVMFISDYDSGTEGARGTTGGQKCHVSLDNGYTFETCFVFDGDWAGNGVTNPENITDFDRPGAHIHGVVYDPKQGVVWLITGDGAIYNDNSSFFWSRDLGATWTHVRSTIEDTGQRCQMVNAVPFDGCIAFGSDASVMNGVGVITYLADEDDTMRQEVAYDLHAGEPQGLKTYARNVWESQRYGVKYMSFGRNAQLTDPAVTGKSAVLASSNGYHWEEVWVVDTPDIRANVFCFDDPQGRLFIALDGAAPYARRIIVCEVSFR